MGSPSSKENKTFHARFIINSRLTAEVLLSFKIWKSETENV
jgi:hypothetical protein